MRLFFSFFLLSLITLSHAFSHAFANDETLNIYSYRKAYLLTPVLNAFTEKTGIQTSVVYAKEGLIARTKSEGKNSPADLIIAPSFDVLSQAIKNGVTQSFPSSLIPASLPSWLYDTHNLQWIALSLRSRLIFTSRDRVDQNSLSSYQDLAHPRFKGKICIRTGFHPYNISLFSEYYLLHGNNKTRTFLKGLKNNLARRPQGNDRDQLRAISNGTCDLALVNSYYYLIMKNGSKEQQKIVENITPFTPSQPPMETHVNMSGAVLAKWAPHKEKVFALITYLLKPEAQKLYIQINKEWPVILPKGSRTESLFQDKNLSYTKEQHPDWEAIIKSKPHVITILEDINFNEAP